MQIPSIPLICPDCAAAAFWYYDGRCEQCYQVHEQLKHDRVVASAVLNAIKRDPAVLAAFIEALKG